MVWLVFIGIFAAATGWIGWKLSRCVADRKEIHKLEQTIQHARKAREIRQANSAASNADIDDKLRDIYRD